MLYDSHMHTTNSDGRSTVAEMCEAALKRGIAGIAITDHADMNFYESRDTYNRIRRSIQENCQAKDDYAGRLEVLCGVELGEYLYAPQNADKILKLQGYDSILCSVHFVPAARWDKAYNRIDFANDGTDAELREYLGLYFDLLSETMDAFDFDILTHIACPVRYMTTKHGRPTDVMEFAPQIRKILQKVVDRNLSLEWNTAGCRQNEEIFDMYRRLGGEKITIGSDAHHCDDICRKFDIAADSLRDIGFTHYYYYKDRKPCSIDL